MSGVLILAGVLLLLYSVSWQNQEIIYIYVIYVYISKITHPCIYISLSICFYDFMLKSFKIYRKVSRIVQCTAIYPYWNSLNIYHFLFISFHELFERSLHTWISFTPQYLYFLVFSPPFFPVYVVCYFFFLALFFLSLLSNISFLSLFLHPFLQFIYLR